MDHRSADFNRALHCANESEAFAGFLKAAEEGCLRAQFLVGLAYHTGRGVPLDYDRAAEWYRKAAGSGDGHAIANLGVMSLRGQGAPPDDLDAYAWIQSAVGLGHAWLRPILQLLEQRITGSGDIAAIDRVRRSAAPEAPVFAPCTRPECDPSRCTLA